MIGTLHMLLSRKIFKKENLDACRELARDLKLNYMKRVISPYYEAVKKIFRKPFEARLDRRGLNPPKAQYSVAEKWREKNGEKIQDSGSSSLRSQGSCSVAALGG